MKVRIDTARCTGNAMCAFAGPAVFLVDDDTGYAYLQSEDVPPELERQARDGANMCPERAITIVDE